MIFYKQYPDQFGSAHGYVPDPDFQKEFLPDVSGSACPETPGYTLPVEVSAFQISSALLLV